MKSILDHRKNTLYVRVPLEYAMDGSEFKLELKFSDLSIALIDLYTACFTSSFFFPIVFGGGTGMLAFDAFGN